MRVLTKINYEWTHAGSTSGIRILLYGRSEKTFSHMALTIGPEPNVSCDGPGLLRSRVQIDLETRES